MLQVPSSFSYDKYTLRTKPTLQKTPNQYIFVVQ